MQETLIAKYGKQHENNLIGAAEQLSENKILLRLNFKP